MIVAWRVMWKNNRVYRGEKIVYSNTTDAFMLAAEKRSEFRKVFVKGLTYHQLQSILIHIV